MDRVKGWFTFGDHEDENAASVLAIANDYLARRELDEALKQYQRIIKKWPESREAVPSLYAVAHLHQVDEQYFKSFDCYEQLLDDYPGAFSEDKILGRQLRISKQVAELPKSRLAIITGANPTRKAYGMLEKIIERAPDSKPGKAAQQFADSLIDREELPVADSDPLEADTEIDDKDAYEENGEIGKWRLFKRPAENSPSAQLDFANTLRDHGRQRKSTKQYQRLVEQWPSSPEAAQAQLAIGQMLEEKEKFVKAFDAYQDLMDNHAGRFPHDEVLDRQFRIARHLLTARKGKFLFLPGFKAPERAIPLLDKIVSNGPRWHGAAEAQYLIGYAYELNRDYELAVIGYSACEFRYPNSNFSEEAAFSRANCLYLISQESPNDNAAMENAWGTLTLFRSTYPRSSHREVVAAEIDALYFRRAQSAFTKADFYDRIARKPEAALISYRDFVEKFPNSEWTSVAETRIEALSTRYE